MLFRGRGIFWDQCIPRDFCWVEEIGLGGNRQGEERKGRRDKVANGSYTKIFIKGSPRCSQGRAADMPRGGRANDDIAERET